MKKNIDWRKIKSRDEQEWSLLFSEHVDFLYSYGMKINRDSCVVKDVIQEVFISLYEKRNSLDDLMNVRAYLCRAVRYKLLDQLKKAPHLSIEEISEEEFLLAVKQVQSSDNIEIAKKSSFVQKMLDKLSPRQREIIYLRYFRDMDIEEIVTTIGINKQSIYNLLSSALKIMRKHKIEEAVSLFVLFIIDRL